MNVRVQIEEKAARGICVVNMTVVKREDEKEQDEERDATVNETRRLDKHANTCCRVGQLICVNTRKTRGAKNLISLLEP